MVVTVKAKDNTEINTLTSECVKNLHDLLSINAELIGSDAVEPRGVKDYNALERAIARQTTGYGNWIKYDNPFLNCATLIYGINKNHVFHNGNKRASFLSMIKHLYVNGYVLRPEVAHKDIYSLILSIADKPGSIYKFAKKYAISNPEFGKSIFNFVGKNKNWAPEDEIKYISLWLTRATISKHIHPKFRMKINDLKKILEKKKIYLEVINNGVIKLYQTETRKSFLGLSTTTHRINEKTYTLGNSKLSEISKGTVDRVRKDFNLTISDGFDNITFYDDGNFIDEQMTIYKGIIYRLSKT